MILISSQTLLAVRYFHFTQYFRIKNHNALTCLNEINAKHHLIILGCSSNFCHQVSTTSRPSGLTIDMRFDTAFFINFPHKPNIQIDDDIIDLPC